MVTAFVAGTLVVSLPSIVTWAASSDPLYMKLLLDLPVHQIALL
jgi:hypothetical protein